LCLVLVPLQQLSLILAATLFWGQSWKHEQLRHNDTETESLTASAVIHERAFPVLAVAARSRSAAFPHFVAIARESRPYL
jgi:hypothetical protein